MAQEGNGAMSWCNNPVTPVQIIAPRLVKSLVTTLTFFNKILRDYELNLHIFETVFAQVSPELYAYMTDGSLTVTICFLTFTVFVLTETTRILTL
jgi:hypothetical protein